MGYVPARAFADSAEAPTAAIVVMRRFGIAFAAGRASRGAELLEALRGWHPWYEIADPPEDWHPLLADWSPGSYATVRYEFTNDPLDFDLSVLRALGQPPEGCELRAYDRELAEQALAAPWSEDQLGGYEGVDDFLRRGFGIAVTRGGRLMAGCTSFCRHVDGYEIQVDTHPERRGKGYATSACAAFILETLARGQRPCWDAANSTSLRLAQKLGYVLRRSFLAWMLIPSGTDAEAVARQVIGETDAT